MRQYLSKGTSFVLLLFFVLQALGHNPQVSTLAFNQAPSGAWNVMVRAPLFSFQLALQHQFPQTDVNALTPEEFKQLLTSYLQNSIVINANKGPKLTMDSVSIALGHEVLVMGKLNAVFPYSSIYSISNQVFALLKDHFSILSIEMDGKEMLKTVLNKENEFTAQLNGFEEPALLKSADKGDGQIALYVLFIILMFVFFYKLLSKR